jgi:hypothetical protein
MTDKLNKDSKAPEVDAGQVQNEELPTEELDKIAGGEAVSTIMKTKHDTAKNTISNIH